MFTETAFLPSEIEFLPPEIIVNPGIMVINPGKTRKFEKKTDKDETGQTLVHQGGGFDAADHFVEVDKMIEIGKDCSPVLASG